MGLGPGEESRSGGVAAQAIEAQPVSGQITPARGQVLARTRTTSSGEDVAVVGLPLQEVSRYRRRETGSGAEKGVMCAVAMRWLGNARSWIMPWPKMRGRRRAGIETASALGKQMSRVPRTMARHALPDRKRDLPFHERICAVVGRISGSPYPRADPDRIGGNNRSRSPIQGNIDALEDELEFERGDHASASYPTVCEEGG